MFLLPRPNYMKFTDTPGPSKHFPSRPLLDHNWSNRMSLAAWSGLVHPHSLVQKWAGTGNWDMIHNRASTGPLMQYLACYRANQFTARTGPEVCHIFIDDHSKYWWNTLYLWAMWVYLTCHFKVLSACSIHEALYFKCPQELLLKNSGPSEVVVEQCDKYRRNRR